MRDLELPGRSPAHARNGMPVPLHIVDDGPEGSSDGGNARRCGCSLRRATCCGTRIDRYRGRLFLPH